MDEEIKLQERNVVSNEDLFRNKVEMEKMLAELKKKMNEIDDISKKLEEKRRIVETQMPARTEKMLQEIKVPSLEMLK